MASPLPEGAHCPNCGYDLRGSTSPRCSECGLDLATLRAGQSQIPWSHRHQLGRWRAYWETVWWGSFRVKRLAAEAALPVNHHDAQRFRWMTVAIVFATILAAQGLARLNDADAFSWFDEFEWILLPVNAAILLTLAAWTGLPSYFFHPRSLPLPLQNRSIALSYYMAAPLAWLPIALQPVLIWIALDVSRPLPPTTEANVSYGSLGICLALFALWWLTNLIRLSRLTLRHTPATLKIAFIVPLLWILVGTLTICGPPLLIFWLILVAYTWLS